MSGTEIRGGIFCLVADCTTINCPYFCFQNCNQCSNMFPNLTLVGVSRFILSICPRGINTIHSQPSLPISILNALAMSSSPVAHVPSFTSSLANPIHDPASYMSLQKSNVSMNSKEMTRLSNWISDLPEEICISKIIKPTIEL